MMRAWWPVISALVLLACSVADPSRLESKPASGGDGSGGGGTIISGGVLQTGGTGTGGMGTGGTVTGGTTSDPLCASPACQWSEPDVLGCQAATVPSRNLRPSGEPLDGVSPASIDPIYLGLTRVWLGESSPLGTEGLQPWQTFGFDLDGTCTGSVTCLESLPNQGSCMKNGTPVPVDGNRCIDNGFARLQPIAAGVPDFGDVFGITEDSINCSLHRGSYNQIVKISEYNGSTTDDRVRVDFYTSPGLQTPSSLTCPREDFRDSGFPLWIASQKWLIAEGDLAAMQSDVSGLPPSARLSTDDAFVRNGYLVAHLDDGYRITLPGDRAEFPGFDLPLSRAVYVAKLERQADSTWAVSEGLVAGALAREALITAFRELGVCAEGDYASVYSAVETYVQEGADLLLDGSVDPEQPCDAVSAGIMFTAKTVTPGGPLAIRERLDCCDADNFGTESCPLRCGDGRISGSENCDIAIPAGEPGACPADCPAGDACKPRTLVGEGCAAVCQERSIATAINGDGCCPPSANSENDDDCEPECGNGVVEGAEMCDPPSACPVSAECTVTDACTLAVYSGAADTCDATCTFTEVTACQGGDGCCPSGCSFSEDDDCPDPGGCGNGTPDPGEFCDGDCPDSCPDLDGDACTADRLVGEAQQCTARCTVTEISGCSAGDGCCPPQCNANNDADCRSICGNRIVEGSEACDDGNDANLDGCVNCQIETEVDQCLSLSNDKGVSEACRACTCNRCATEVLACSNSGDQRENEQCGAVLLCGEINGCSSQVCYCGWNLACFPPIGPCVDEIEAAADTILISDVLARQDDLNYPLGRAKAVGACTDTNCADECGF